MLDYMLEHIVSYTATLRLPPEVIGETPAGLRMNFYVTGGEASGPRIRGRILPVGGDWFTVRRDGVGVLDVRFTLETHDGALIAASYTGVLDLGEDGYARALRGELPQRAAIQAAPRFETAHPACLWLNRLQCVSVGGFDLATATVSYDVYALRSR